ncbi:peptidoglycan-associated lipoprotein Pal [Aurantiacibacter suaedae]|uniref:peptidoglycan-associated lipoprotein Pal n=1 Tax=Aurantiacibacter suaedae TaxID=2545755 RepID=UPI0010F57EB5|nr:peptidoglycan-associated lipoprotein Pal [Aurantiacibacter suaedae]
MNRIVIALTMSSVLALAACKKEPPEEIPPAPRDVSTPAPTPASTPRGPQPGSQTHFSTAMAGADTIYFDTDQYDIDATDMAALRRQAEYLTQYPSARATVEGHADERGTRDYNLALGERRANAARAYLVSLGIAENRLRVVSYGEERPVDTASTPAAWARNRRAVTVMID